MRFFLIIFMLFFISINIYPQVTQEWIANYSSPQDDRPNQMATDNMGNIYVAGNKNFNFVTIKYNSSGEQQWIETYVSPGFVQGIAVDGSSNVYITGYADGNGTGSDYLTIKYDSFGVRQWAARYTGSSTMNSTDVAYDIKVDAEGNAYVTGGTVDSLTGGNYTTIKYSTSGIQLWIAKYNHNPPGNLADIATSLTLDKFGNIYVTGCCLTNNIYGYNDYVTIKYNSLGMLQWSDSYNGPGDGDDRAIAIVADSMGNSFVTGYSKGISTELEYCTIKYNTSGNRMWVQRYNQSGSNHFPMDISVDSKGNCYVTGGYTDPVNTASTIKYSPSGNVDWIDYRLDFNARTLCTDKNNNVYLSGIGWRFLNRDFKTIKFDSSGIQQWIMEHGEPLNRQDEPIDNIVDEDLNVYVTGYSIGSTVSDIVTIKYSQQKDLHLSKIIGIDTVKYNVRKNSFSFQNNEDNMWPSSWWCGFDYSFLSIFDTIEIPPRYIFPDWYLYRTICNASIRPKPVKNWIDNARKWNGSCLGFSVISLFSFYHDPNFISQFPLISSSIDDIYSIPIDDYVRKTINHIQTAGLFSFPTKTTYPEAPSPANSKLVLDRLKSIFKNPGIKLNMFLALFSESPIAGHAVVPFKIRKDPLSTSKYFIYCYDSNNPGTDTCKLVIDTLDNSWSWGNGLNYHGGSNIYLAGPVESFLGIQQNLVSSKSVNYEREQNSSDTLEFYASGANSVVMLSPVNDTICGFNKISKKIHNFEKSIIPITNGSFNPPIGYRFTETDYSIIMSDFDNDTNYSFTGLYIDSTNYFRYSRKNLNSVNQTDLIQKENSKIVVVNSDNQGKAISVSRGDFKYNSEKLYNVTNCNMSSHDSIGVKLDPVTSLEIYNYGDSKDYTLDILNSTQSSMGSFHNSVISISGNSSQRIVPSNWENLNTSNATIYIDLGMNGSIDDTLFINNQTGITKLNSIEPEKFSLNQNFPNPFNPITNIPFDIPKRSFVTLNVFDITGKQISTLLNQFLLPGSYQIKFDGSNLSSGVYYYTLNGNDFFDTKKMILIK